MKIFLQLVFQLKSFQGKPLVHVIVEIYVFVWLLSPSQVFNRNHLDLPLVWKVIVVDMILAMRHIYYSSSLFPSQATNRWLEHNVISFLWSNKGGQKGSPWWHGMFVHYQGTQWGLDPSKIRTKGQFLQANGWCTQWREMPNGKTQFSTEFCKINTFKVSKALFSCAT